ncbi:hypothetical protein B0A48_03299 [Cryoendolithus antarcticus]|uniref:F-box domain-containing protein n=1 Tax=Cryoendolithus antarcticus TaxID=1507870 RepID=A0A1V8TK36_9PEZI|nr:hypothetical protein B0A48_03299 [Cryoendolithus antarcticus]
MSNKYSKLEYGKCKMGELRQFVQDREVTDPIGPEQTAKRSRPDLIKHLRKLDLAKSFPRFNDLPPEVRLLIYEYPLTYDGYGSEQTAILRVSKQTYAEALPILYTINLFEIRVDDADPEVFVGGCFRGRFKLPLMTGYSKTYPVLKAMRNARHLRLRLTASKGLTPKDLAEFKEVTRASGLMMLHAPHLKTLDVAFKYLVVGSADETALKVVLRPLALISSGVRITTTGASFNIGPLLDESRRVLGWISPDDVRALHKTMRKAYAVMKRLKSAARNMGEPHRSNISGIIERLYFGSAGAVGLDAKQIKSQSKALENAVEGGDEFEEALAEAMKLQFHKDE